MDMARESRGCLMVCAPGAGADEGRCANDAVSAYQRARASFGHLTLLGVGVGCAYCLMLAQRFAPDALVLAPFEGGEGGFDAFLAAARRLSRGLYAVCAPITVLAPGELPPADEKKLRRLLSHLRAADRQVKRFSGAREIQTAVENMANRLRIIKTLA